MVAYVTPFLDRAKSFIKVGEHVDLYHAALELRFAIEEIVYDKLKLRLKNVAPGEIDKWQPDRVIQQIQDLVDPTVGVGAQLFVKPEQGPGSEEEPIFVGASKGIIFKEVRKHWQKLGSYLHRPKPAKGAKVDSTTSDLETIKSYLQEVIAYVEELSSTGFDGFLSANVTFDCAYCKSPIARTEDTLKDQQIIKCYNSECGKEFLVFKEDENWTISPNTINFPCKKCEDKIELNAVELQRIPKEFPISTAGMTTCDACGAEHQISWSLRYGLRVSQGGSEEASTDPPDTGGNSSEEAGTN